MAEEVHCVNYGDVQPYVYFCPHRQNIGVAVAELGACNLAAAAVAALVFSNCWIAVEGLAAGDPTLY